MGPTRSAGRRRHWRRRPNCGWPFVTNNASSSPSAIAEHLTRSGSRPRRRRDHFRAGRGHADGPPVPGRVLVLVIGATRCGSRCGSGGSGRSAPCWTIPWVVQGVRAEVVLTAAREAGCRPGWRLLSWRPTPTRRCRRRAGGNQVTLTAAGVITATGPRPVVAGKPETPLHAEAVARTGARHALVVGDRLDTDIEGAVRGGADAMLVMTGASRTTPCWHRPGEGRRGTDDSAAPSDSLRSAAGRPRRVAGLLQPRDTASRPFPTGRRRSDVAAGERAGRRIRSLELTGDGDLDRRPARALRRRLVGRAGLA